MEKLVLNEEQKVIFQNAIKSAFAIGQQAGKFETNVNFRYLAKTEKDAIDQVTKEYVAD